MWALVAVAGILWLAYSTYLDHQQKLARTGAPDDLRRELDAAHAERDALRTRIEALEAIVTDDGFDLEREARRAGIAAPRIDLDALPDAESDTRTGDVRRRVR